MAKEQGTGAGDAPTKGTYVGEMGGAKDWGPGPGGKGKGSRSGGDGDAGEARGRAGSRRGK